MTTPCLSSITLGVRDRARSLAFYQAVGFRLLADDALGTVLTSHCLNLVLRNWTELADEFGVAPQAGGFRGSHVTLQMADQAAVDETYESWISAGGIGVRQPSTKDWGGYAGVLADPDAHLWELSFSPNAAERLGGTGADPSVAAPDRTDTAADTAPEPTDTDTAPESADTATDPTIAGPLSGPES